MKVVVTGGAVDDIAAHYLEKYGLFFFCSLVCVLSVSCAVLLLPADSSFSCDRAPLSLSFNESYSLCCRRPDDREDHLQVRAAAVVSERQGQGPRQPGKESGLNWTFGHTSLSKSVYWSLFSLTNCSLSPRLC